MPTKEELKKLQSDPLPQKVILTKARIREWYYKHGGQVYVSFSGGKDSTVLLHLVREEFPDVEAIFVDTGLEYPEIREFAKSFENVGVVRPSMGFADVIRKYGYPMLSKMISHNVGIARRKPEGNVARNTFNPEKKGVYAMHKWLPLTKVDFLLSEKCCDIMKKAPAKKVDKAPILATMAVESSTRRDKWIKYGCNMYDAEKPKSAPMSFWTEQDVLRYIYEKGLPIASVYGDVTQNCEQMSFFTEECKLCTTGCHRTGCVFCGFGAHLVERGEGRFQRLKRTHPKLWNYCMNGGSYDSDGLWKPDKNGLGMKHVFDTMNDLYGENFVRYE